MTFAMIADDRNFTPTLLRTAILSLSKSMEMLPISNLNKHLNTSRTNCRSMVLDIMPTREVFPVNDSSNLDKYPLNWYKPGWQKKGDHDSDASYYPSSKRASPSSASRSPAGSKAHTTPSPSRMSRSKAHPSTKVEATARSHKHHSSTGPLYPIPSNNGTRKDGHHRHGGKGRKWKHGDRD